MSFAQDMLKEDLGFLEDIVVHEIDGKKMMGTADLPFNVAVILDEKEFVKKWLMPFALGNDNGINYFPGIEWSKMTNRGMQSAMVVDENNKPVCLIGPLTSHNLTDRDFALLRMASLQIQQNQANEQTKMNLAASMPTARMLERELSKARVSITDLVAPEFYAKHGINPKAEKKIYYIKDVINKVKDPVTNEIVSTITIEEVNRSRPLLYKLEAGETLSQEDYRFLHIISKGRLDIKDIQGKAAVNTTVAPDVPDDPTQC